MKEPIVAVLFVLLIVVGGIAYVGMYDREPPGAFRLTLDEPAEQVYLRLRNADGEAVSLMDGGPTEFTASSEVEHSSTAVTIEWPDFSRTICILSEGDDAEAEQLEFSIEHRTCPGGEVNDGF